MSKSTHNEPELTIENAATILKNDPGVKVAGVDIDGILRGKLMATSKFLSLLRSGRAEFGFCSVVFGWDMHDQTYMRELGVSNQANGYRDVIARIDLSSFRRIPWEGNVPFFLVEFYEPGGQRVCACPRGLLASVVEDLEGRGITAKAGAEYEFFTFRAPTSSLQDEGGTSAATTRFLKNNPPHSLPHLSEGMLGYSLMDPLRNQEWFYDIFKQCDRFNCGIEGWHTESGPGVFEAALLYDEIKSMADKAALFKYTVKAVSTPHGITPCFMAKPRPNLPGNSGHIHISLADSKTGKNLFALDPKQQKDSQPTAQYSDLQGVSLLGRHFLAGVLEGLPSIMPLFAPTINSYKRLVENFWAPVTVSWGLEHRAASIRLIAPPTCDPKATRLEVRVPGADSNPYLALSAIVACGWRGVKKELAMSIKPLGPGQDVGGADDKGQRLAKSLKEAVAVMMAPGSVAREVLGDAFVEHFGGTREHEIRLWDEAVTDWELKRYIEMV